MPNSVLFLDRDGVINVDRGYIHRFANASLFPEFSNWLVSGPMNFSDRSLS
jgi:histidinol phosphatase-like enzyme